MSRRRARSASIRAPAGTSCRSITTCWCNRDPVRRIRPKAVIRRPPAWRITTTTSETRRGLRRGEPEAAFERFSGVHAGAAGSSCRREAEISWRETRFLRVGLTSPGRFLHHAVALRRRCSFHLAYAAAKSERQQHVHDLLAIARLLHVGHLPAAAIGDARLRD